MLTILEDKITRFAKDMRFPAKGNAESIEAFENRVRTKATEWLIHRVMEYGMLIRQNQVVHYRPHSDRSGRPLLEPVTEAELYYSVKEPETLPSEE